MLNFDIEVVGAGNANYKVKLDDHNGGSTENLMYRQQFGVGTYNVNMSDLLVNVDGNGVGGNMSLTTVKAVVYGNVWSGQDVVFGLTTFISPNGGVT